MKTGHICKETFLHESKKINKKERKTVTELRVRGNSEYIINNKNQPIQKCPFVYI